MARRSGSDSPVLLYDGECRVCTIFARLLARADLRKQMDILPLQDVRARNLLTSMSQEEVMGSSHFVTAERRIFSGQDAVHHALSQLSIFGGPYGRLTGGRLGRRLEGYLYDLGVAIRNWTECAGPT